MDAEHIWTAIAEAVGESLRPTEHVVSVGLTGTCPTIVLVDDAARPLRHAILYLDNRGASEIAAVANAVGGADAYFQSTGNHLGVSTCVAATLRWVQRKEPAVWSRTRVVGFLNTFVSARLTGHAATDPTHASYTGLFSLKGERTKWDLDLCRTLGIDPAILPPILEPYECVGFVTPQAAKATGLAPGTPVAVGAADTAAASLAVDICQPQSAFESMGTSGVITFCLDTPNFEPTFMNRCHIRPGLWLAHGAMSTLGGSLGWLRQKIWPDLPSFAELETLAADSIPRSERRRVSPIFVRRA